MQRWESEWWAVTDKKTLKILKFCFSLKNNCSELFCDFGRFRECQDDGTDCTAAYIIRFAGIYIQKASFCSGDPQNTFISFSRYHHDIFPDQTVSSTKWKSETTNMKF